MRFLRVRAGAFGPFGAGQELSFAPGMNVVFGGNEAGKSSWHAALYAGLCGMRKGQGKTPVQDQLFTERHRPWGATPDWLVTVVVWLQDGVELEFQQNLALKSATVIDGLGRPFSVPYTEGSIDGARLLGLDRKAFLATACVRQAELLAVRNAGDQLQAFLQQAVATGGNDATLVKALSQMDSFMDNNLGTDHVLAKKPLRAAMDAVPKLRTELEAAQHSHEQHLKRVEDVAALRGQVQAARHNLRVAQAKLASNEARSLEDRATRAEAIRADFPDGPPASALGDVALAEQVTTALTSWRELRHAPVVEGPSAAELRALLATLPESPVHDTEVHPAVLEAAQELHRSRQRLEDHRSQEPPTQALPITGGLDGGALRSLAFRLRQRATPADPVIAKRLQQAETALKAAVTAAPSHLPLVAGCLLLVLGLVLVLVQPAFGLPAALLGGLLLARVALTRTRSGPSAALQAEFDAARAAVVEQQSRNDALNASRDEAMTEARVHGLPAEPDQLEQLAADLAVAQQQQAQRESWLLTLATREADAEGVAPALRTALAVRGVTEPGDPLTLYAGYEAACRAAAEVALQVARRADLEQRISEREQREAAAEEEEEAQARALVRLEDAGLVCGVAATDPAGLVGGLDAWQQQHTDRAAGVDAQNRRWADLQRLLGEAGGIDRLLQQAHQRRADAEALTAGFSSAELNDLVQESGAGVQIEQLREVADDLAGRLAGLDAEVKAEAAGLRAVAEATESLATAEAELARVRQLEETLQLTRRFLTTAQERVQRDIAPRLKQSVETWLPSITGGRYREVFVDPQTLTVRVRMPDGSPREADLLSHGTAEQVYLLLRMTMAQHLTKPGEVCPLILDDVTAQSDRMRTQAILETLHVLSAERQIILFTQEDDVLAWAEQHLLRDDHDRLKVLDPAVAMA